MSGGPKPVDGPEDRIDRFIYLLLQQVSLITIVGKLWYGRFCCFSRFYGGSAAWQLFEMHMRAGRPAGIPRESHDRAGFNRIAGTDSNQSVVPIQGAISVGMFNDDGVTIAATITSKNDSTFTGGMNWCANRDSNIDPTVKDKLATSEWVNPPSNPRGNDAVLYRQIKIRQRHEREIQ